MKKKLENEPLCNMLMCTTWYLLLGNGGKAVDQEILNYRFFFQCGSFFKGAEKTE